MDELADRTVISAYSRNWLNRLEQCDDSIWDRQIQPGKATIGEIIGHLLHWDEHLISNVLPSVLKGEGMTFPDIDTFNRVGYAYVSHVTRERLIREFIHTRKQLGQLLLNVPAHIRNRPTTANGAANCPRTGKPYTLMLILSEFMEHDEHHQRQIDRFRLLGAHVPNQTREAEAWR